MRTSFILIAVALCLVTGCSDDTTESKTDSGVSTDAGGDSGVKADASTAADEVITDKGKIKGSVKTGYREFLGIPYARAPKGKLRWTKPEPPDAWTKTLVTTKFGNQCPQIALVGAGSGSPMDEDCLFVNVWTPHPALTKAAPVMVWIHGGAFVTGSADLATYNGAKIAAKTNTVVVSLNYRLGPLGFLAHPSLGEGAGNFGMLDQQAALRWVQKNIAAFGGDPKNVTIFGESAGSVSVGAHQAMAGSKGLFHKAIMQSGGLSQTLNARAKAETQGKELAKKLACDTAKDVLTCMRGKSADAVKKALPMKSGFFFGAGATWGPVIDGKVLTGQPLKLVKDGKGNKVPLLIGSNADEGTLFLFLAGLMAMTPAAYTTSLKAAFGAKAADVEKEYPVSAYASAAYAFADVLGDLAFVCPSRATARAVSATGQDAYLYHFTVEPSFSLLKWLKAYHSAEIQFIFESATSFTKAEQTLSSRMMGYWSSFARGGTPNGPKSNDWPKFNKAGDEHMVLGLTPGKSKNLKQKKCDFWDKLGAGL